jgi:L-serine/L-threonine ammonia-lyase
MKNELIAKDPNAIYVPPFDHEDVWEGNSTMVDELEKQMQDVGGYQGLVCSVGGGGLLIGLMLGLSKYGRLQGGSLDRRGVRVLAMETEGAESLHVSVKNDRLTKLDAITSIATSLGATQVASKCFEVGVKPEVTSCVFSDAEAAMASVAFADDERIMVEPACGVSIAPCYNDTLRTLLFPDVSEEKFSKLNIVIVVCGGSKATLQILEAYRKEYSNDARVMKKFHKRRLASEKKNNLMEKID